MHTWMKHFQVLYECEMLHHTYSLQFTALISYKVEAAVKDASSSRINSTA